MYYGYLDIDLVKTTKHVIFDGVINELGHPIANVVQLILYLYHPLPYYPEDTITLFPPSPEFQGIPFPSISDIPVKITFYHDSLEI